MVIIASNFKTNHTRQSTKEFISFVNDYLTKNSIKNEIIVFPTATSLDNEFGIKTILIGHSERRHILGETQEQIAQKFNFYKELGYKIIYCIGEPLEVKEQGLEKTLEYIYEQFVGIDTNYENLILAYEPVWAIGTGVTATSEDIVNVHNAWWKRKSK
jgi:triosephosphate isomerase